jgi:tight adherence protein B
VIAVATVTLGVLATVAFATAARRAPSVDRVRRLRPRRGLRLPAPAQVRIGSALSRADIDLTPDEAVRLWPLAALVGGGMGFAFSAPAAIPVALAVLAGAPVALFWARGRGDARVAAALPGTLDRVAAGLRAGSTVGEGLGGLGATSSPLAPDLRRIEARTHLGVTLVDALGQWSHERPLPGVRAVAGALALAVSVGGACAGALEGLGESLRARDATIREAQALSAQARLSAYVVGAAPLGYLLFATIADPGSLDALISTNAGRGCLIAGLILEALAAVWMRALLGRTP